MLSLFTDIVLSVSTLAKSSSPKPYWTPANSNDNADNVVADRQSERDSAKSYARRYESVDMFVQQTLRLPRNILQVSYNRTVKTTSVYGAFPAQRSTCRKIDSNKQAADTDCGWTSGEKTVQRNFFVLLPSVRIVSSDITTQNQLNPKFTWDTKCLWHHFGAFCVQCCRITTGSATAVVETRV